MPNIVGITDDILVIGYDNNGTDHECNNAQGATKMHEEVNLKLNKEKCHFRCMYIPFFGEVIFEKRSTTRPTENQSPHGYASTKQQGRAPSIPGNY